jgi:hypothetical protein
MDCSVFLPGFENTEVKIANDYKKGKELIVILKTKLLSEVEIISRYKQNETNIIIGGLYIVHDSKKYPFNENRGSSCANGISFENFSQSHFKKCISEFGCKANGSRLLCASNHQ